VTSLVEFKLLGFETLDEYLNHFHNTLLRSVHGYDFFVDWEKVVNYVQQHFIEFGLLNGLTLLPNNDVRKRRLKEILTEHPKTIQIIPSLIAVRDKNIEIADLTRQVVYSRFDFGDKNPNPKDIDDMVLFCEKTGIVNLFGNIKDVYTYALGVEVGLDSNARKNRSGDAFKALIKTLIDSEIKQLVNEGYPFSYKPEIELKTLKIGYPKQKKADFVIYYRDSPLVICEANIYHVAGSKPMEIIRSYTDMGGILKDLSKKFLWFTDGPAWVEMWSAFTQGVNDLNYILNYDISLKKLREILLSFVS
jgi:type II restriction enzyme